VKWNDISARFWKSCGKSH